MTVSVPNEHQEGENPAIPTENNASGEVGAGIEADSLQELGESIASELEEEVYQELVTTVKTLIRSGGLDLEDKLRLQRAFDAYNKIYKAYLQAAQAFQCSTGGSTFMSQQLESLGKELEKHTSTLLGLINMSKRNYRLQQANTIQIIPIKIKR